MFSKSIFPYLGVIIGALVGGWKGALAGFFISAILHGVIRGLKFKNMQNEDIMARKVNYLASLIDSNTTMLPLSIKKQQEYVDMFIYMENKSRINNKTDRFNRFMSEVKTIHFEGNNIIGLYLRKF